MKIPPVLKHHTGIKFLYRKYLGVPLAYFFYKKFGNFNPNIITISRFLVYAICSFLFVLYRNPFLFVFGIQFNLIIDYVDGSYARLTNQVTRFGEILDGFIDIIIPFSLFVILFCVTVDGPISAITLTFFFLTYALNNQIAKFQPQVKGVFAEGETEKVEEDNFLKNLLKSPFGFTLSHVYLYLSLWVLFSNVYILIVLISMGLLASFKTILSFFRK